jgi:hypothetical protein
MKVTHVLTLLLLISLSGCYRVNVESAIPGGRIVEQREHFFAFGTMGESKMEMAKLCPEGVASFGDRFTAKDVALAVASVGVYTPKTVWVQCQSDGPRAQF